MELVVGEVEPVVNKLPPDEALYQRVVFPFAPVVADIVPVPQIAVLLTVGEEGRVFTVILTGILGPSHPVEALYFDT